MGQSGLEPPTSRLSGARSNQLSYEPISSVGTHRSFVRLPYLATLSGGDEGVRTLDPLLAGQVLSQLSYTPIGVLRFLNDRFSGHSKLNNKKRFHCIYANTLSPISFLASVIDAPSALADICSTQIRSRGTPFSLSHILHRKEVIQPHLPIRLPCYDLTPIIDPTFGSCLLTVSPLTSGVTNFHGLTGGVYKARERIHRGMLTRDY